MSEQSHIKWDDALDVGVEKMNEEHKMLIQAMDALFLLNRQGATKNELLHAFEHLIYVTGVHFSDEEAFMQETGYEGLEQHRQIHQSLLKAVIEQKNEFSKDISGKLPSAVFDFFKTWLTTHIMIVDKKYGPSK